MDLRKSFDSEVANYDKWRPRYCNELFSDIIEYSKLDSEKECIEIGCGTGQATEPILKTGSSLLALELGENFTEFSRNKFSHYKNFQIENADFEKFELVNNKFDLMFSGTAFHWISEEIGYPKVYNILKSGGTMALFWNKPGPKSFDDQLHLKMQEVYAKYRGPEEMQKAKIERENPQERYAKIISTIEKYGFVGAECRLFKQVREFTADEYIGLLSTYSDNIALQEPVKTQFLTDIRDVIYSFNNIIKVYDTMELYLSKKP
jgi:trans-aconitate methyltransferase